MSEKDSTIPNNSQKTMAGALVVILIVSCSMVQL